MWFASNLAFVYTLVRLSINDTPTNATRRDVTNFFTPQGCLEFLRVTRDQTFLPAHETSSEHGDNSVHPLKILLLMVPAFIRTACGFVVSGREALCVLLYRLAFPCRLKGMRLVFGLIESCICETFNWMLHFMDFKWGFLLSLNDGRLVPKLLCTFVEAIYNSGCPLSHCWGFIDGTVRGIARPIRNQRFFFNGYKRKHAIKFQGVATPDGLFVDLYGAEVGTRHDAYLLAQAELLRKLQTHINSSSDRPYCLYGDPAYGMSDNVQCPFSASANGPLAPLVSNYN